uniref:UDP-glucose 4-epimerase GalE n=1 Tax=Polynucleobacter sp. TaxID=2029855 RepID=UPI0040478BD0
MNILLTGGLGYIASHVATTLVSNGHQIYLLDNLSNSDIGVLKRLEKITNCSIPFFQEDVRNKGTVEKILADNHIDAVMHFAGLKAVGESSQLPLQYYDNNVAGTIALLEAMQATNVFTLVFSSSATVYGEPHYLPYDEDHPKNPTNPYGQTKLMVEGILHDLANSNERWSIACLRYFNPVGAHESGLIGEDPNGIPNNLMPFVARVASKRLDCLSVFGNDYDTRDGTGERDYIHVQDLAEGHLAALGYLQAHKGWHAINLGSGSATSVLDMIAAFERASGQKIPYKISERRPGDLDTCYAKADKAVDLLQWRTRRTIDQMCASAWNFQKQLQKK